MMKLPAFSEAMGAEQTFADRLLCLALDIGEAILESGGEVHRVEDTIEHICRAYGAVHVEVFAITSLIMASVRMEDNSYSSQIRRVYDSSNRLSRLENFNRISREICKKTPPLEEVDRMIKEEKRNKKMPLWMSVLVYVLVSASFAVLFGGSLWDSLAGALVAGVLAVVSCIRSDYINPLAKTLLLSFLAGTLSYVSVLIGIGENADMIMIATIMLLIPGIAFGNAMRDLLCGDLLAGILKTVQSCISAILIATGYSIAIFWLGNRVPDGIPNAGLHPIVIWIAALLGTLGFALLFDVKRKHLPVISLLGVLTYAVWEISLYAAFSKFLAAFLAAAFVTLCAEVCARIFRAPTVVFLLTAPVVIVPGSSLYYTMNALIMQKNKLLSLHLENLLQISIGMAAGIVAISVLVQGLLRFSARVEKRIKK
jgi:uncharacterized membrane protein YjjP (DUF1212 family)